MKTAKQKYGSWLPWLALKAYRNPSKIVREKTFTYYYHAGVEYENPDPRRGIEFHWSRHTRLTAAAAEREAVKMALKGAGMPIVEYWDRCHGLHPGYDCAEASYAVKP